jgi:hypothetical protein
MSIPSRLLRLETPNPDFALWFVRNGVTSHDGIRRILTSAEGQGSHVLAQQLVGDLGLRPNVSFVHAWKDLLEDPAVEIPQDVDAAFIVKDPADSKTRLGIDRLVAQGFTLAPLELGAQASKLEFLKAAVLPRGFVHAGVSLPERPIATWTVSTYLVAREGLTPRLLAQAAHVLDLNAGSIAARSFQFSASETSELFQGIDAFLSILVNIGLAFLALLGLDTFAYRRLFHDLNTLVSIISMLQSNKDVLGVRDPEARAERLLYLSVCSDLLGLVSAIAGFYTQQNSALLFTNLSEIVHQRCDALKINIQLKVLHATI